MHCFESAKDDSGSLLHFAFTHRNSFTFKGSSFCVSSKAALESLFMTLVKSRIPSTYFSLFRLGMVNVDYKYFSKLSTKDPKKLNQF